MNTHLQNILNSIKQQPLPEEEINAIIKSIQEADKEMEIINFKLDRTEKVKRTTAILLEETIEELEQKRKAVEAQNKELEIEASLERIRTVAMSMNKAEDILNICKTQFIELKQLGFLEIRNALIAIFHDDKNYFTDYDYSDFSKGSITNIPYHQNAVIDNSLQQMKSATDGFTEFVVDGAALVEWKKFRQQNGEYDDSRLEGVNALYYYFYSIEDGSVGISTFQQINVVQLETLKRFRNVFDLAYKRYVDISKAEAQAREAQIETGLERVRSRSLAMQHTSELQDVINTVHKELLHLNIAISGGSFIAINNDIDQVLRCWGSGGTANTSEEVELPLYEKPFCSNLINRIKSSPGFFTEEYSHQEKIAFFTFLFKYPPWSELDDVHKNEILQSTGGYTRSCCVSQHTSIFIINHFGEKFSDDDNNILKRFGKVFEQTYTRFLDLQKAEAQALKAENDLVIIKDARQKAENALMELQATQKQLIQSEKMASLGELTAGIAHEIQNPLNFVNNFSEVNKELLLEIKEELEKGNYEDAKEIMNDVMGNEEKINHHGKRADAIVKGMLQHSRSSTSGKEPTNINKLVDEYLRLAYHGLRAKDKSFNATLLTEYDESMGNIPVIPQDIGRVILNLITNAFYVVDEKKKSGSVDYDPTVTVSTIRRENNIQIAVRDNGNGIPENIIEKIFQPFFTTKPTGQGTGLGLSLSYDIVKAHGGELKVKTNEGEGTTFIIELPDA